MPREARIDAPGALHHIKCRGIVERVSEIFKIAVKYILSPGKQPERVTARSVLAYWAVRELGISGTNVGKRLHLSQSAVSRAVQRGEQLVSEHRLSLYDTRSA